VVLVFLRNFKSVLIICVSIPLSVAAATSLGDWISVKPSPLRNSR